MALNPAQRQAIAAIDGPPEGQAPEGAMPPQQQAPKQETAESRASTQAATETEGDRMNDMPYLEIDFGDGRKRQMTPEQIKGISTRYADLNYKHASLKPVIKMAEDFMRQNPGTSPEQLVQIVGQLAAAQQQNVQFGKGGVNDPDGNGRSDTGKTKMSDDDFSKWEEDNASSLPPGYREMHKNMSEVSQNMQRMMQMMQGGMGQTAGHLDAARAAHQQAGKQQITNARQAIANNLDSAQQRLGLPSEAANDFMTFAAQRGYSLEDFSDPDLTVMVMNDFKNNMQSPEMERLREITKRRAAFTSSTGASPGQGGQLDPSEADFQGFAGRVMDKRRM